MIIRKLPARFLPLPVLAVLAACAAPAPMALNDPHEAANRRTHELNLALDRNVMAPLARGGSGVLDSPVGHAVDNLAGNLSLPSAVLNKVLQGRIEDAVHNTLRFAFNSTIGLAGLFDPATAMGLDKRGTDFGATLHTWGVGEGTFLMLPVLGATTERDALGMVVDLVTDPVGALPKPERYWARGVRFGSKLSDRARFSGTVDSILHESADSYAQLRLMYLQSRRYELGQEAADEAFIDPYEDPYGD